MDDHLASAAPSGGGGTKLVSYVENATNDPTNQPEPNQLLTKKQILAAHIHIHLLFSPGQVSLRR